MDEPHSEGPDLLFEVNTWTGFLGAFVHLGDGALGLVFNAIVLRTTRCIDATVAQLKSEHHEIRDEDIARLSPLEHRDLNLIGRCSFTASTPAAGTLRVLRDPDAPELDEDDDGGQE